VQICTQFFPLSRLGSSVSIGVSALMSQVNGRDVALTQNEEIHS